MKVTIKKAYEKIIFIKALFAKSNDNCVAYNTFP